MKRYDPIQLCDMGGHASGQMEENAEGDYVLFEDARHECQGLVDTAEAAGRTLLDEFAMAALTGLLARETLYSNVAASEAYKYAAEMMKDRIA